MATTRKRKTTTKKTTPIQEDNMITEETNIIPEEKVKESKKGEVTEVKAKKEKIIEPKFKIGDIVFVSKDADADLNGFKLFPQYKKYTYTVEAYEPDTDIYTLRKLNFTLKLKGELILAPGERAHDSINRKRF